MAENKTQPTAVPVADFLASVEPARRRDEGVRLDAIMREVTGVDGVMWGPSIVGYGQMHYTYASGREGDWMKVGFAPRRPRLSIYGLLETRASQALLRGLGPHTTGVGCLYIARLDTVDESTLRTLIEVAFGRDDFVAPGREGPNA